MPIQIKCKCGKTLGIPDGMAGKAVKCPGCKQALQVSGGAASGKSPAPPAANDFMQDLFDEEGFNTAVEAVCPSCRAEMPGNAVLCTKCGYHKESGTTLDAHKTAGVDIDHGTLALDKAAVDMASAVELQKRMLRGGGMPWWGLALTLFMLGSGLLIAVLAVNAERRVDETITFDPMQTFLTLSGAAFLAVANGALLMIFVHAFKQSLQQGFLSLLTPYVFYHVWTNWSETWRYFITLLIAASIGGGLLIAAVS